MSAKTKRQNPEILSKPQKELAIQKIDSLIEKLNKFDPSSIKDRNDPKIRVTEDEIDQLLADIFGTETKGYDRYSHINQLDSLGISLAGFTIDDVVNNLRQNVNAALETLKSIKSGFQEDLQNSGLNKTANTLKAYESLELHPRISAIADTLYKDRHYTQAVEAAIKDLILYVKEKSGSTLDGSTLMQRVFSVNDPLLKINKLQSQTDKDEQQGVMHLFTGAVLSIRNPRAHKHFSDEPERALELIAFISLLAKLVDDSSKN